MRDYNHAGTGLRCSSIDSQTINSLDQQFDIIMMSLREADRRREERHERSEEEGNLGASMEGEDRSDRMRGGAERRRSVLSGRGSVDESDGEQQRGGQRHESARRGAKRSRFGGALAERCILLGTCTMHTVTHTIL